MGSLEVICIKTTNFRKIEDFLTKKIPQAPRVEKLGYIPIKFSKDSLSPHFFPGKKYLSTGLLTVLAEFVAKT